MDISARFLAFTTYGVQWVLWLLIALSVISVSIMLERLWHFATYRPTPQHLVQEIRTLLHSGSALRLALESAGVADALEAACEGAKARERLQLERNLAFLGTLGSNAPFVGLFGTVLGIIKAFHDLAGNQAGGPAVVMAGISEALVATAVGLMVAIPAVVAFNYFNRRVRSSMTEVDWMAHLALAEVKAQAAPSPEGTPAPADKAAPAPVPMARFGSTFGRRLFWIGSVGAILLAGGWLLFSPGTSRPTKPALTTEPTPPPLPTPVIAPTPPAPAPTTPAASTPAPAAAPTGTPPAATTAADVPYGPPAPAATASLPTSPAPATPAAPAPAAPAPAAPVPAAPSVDTPPAAATPAAKPATPAGALKGPKGVKGKKRRPPAAGAAAPGSPPAAAPAKTEEPPKAPEAAPAAPAVP